MSVDAGHELANVYKYAYFFVYVYICINGSGTYPCTLLAKWFLTEVYKNATGNISA